VAGTFPERINSIQVAFVPNTGNQGTGAPKSIIAEGSAEK
jgi:hypothetical protein